MRPFSIQFIAIILFIFLAIDMYVFRGFRLLISDLSLVWKQVLSYIYWLIPLYFFTLLFWVYFKREAAFDPEFYYKVVYHMMGFMVLFYLPKILLIVFVVLSDLIGSVTWLADKASDSKGLVQANWYTRRQFLMKVGFITASIPFLFIARGIQKGRFQVQTRKIALKNAKIPAVFKGFRIVQISDWHIGSFRNFPEKVQAAVEQINDLQPNLVLFTGDMVNNYASELEPFVDYLAAIRASHGKYSILGNHDYGHYAYWKSKAEEENNIHRLKELQARAGFRLLNNEHVRIEEQGEGFTLVGIENWGLPPFPQFGDLKAAMAGVPADDYKLLMSHDPSHWDAQVVQLTDIDLTLSGHTHGMQFGVNMPGFKWSPVKWKYPRWSGMYSEQKQNLYVNVGLGYLAFPGRVGIKPEITVFDLS